MTKKDLKLNSTKIGQLTAKASETNVEVPTAIQIISATARNKYVDGIQTDTIVKIAMQAIDLKAVEVAKSAGFELSEMPSFTVEIIDEKLVAQLSTQTENLVGKIISTNNSSVSLRWISRGQGGSWGGLKLVLDDVKLLERKES